jgi:hypothetical protein
VQANPTIMHPARLKHLLQRPLAQQQLLQRQQQAQVHEALAQDSRQLWHRRRR